MKSTDFLQAAIDVQAERGKQYDQPTGERSMGRTVTAFNAITGRDLTEAEGWLLLQVLKDVRQWQNPSQYHHDSALDGVAYASLKAEALHEAGAGNKVPSEKTRRVLAQAAGLKTKLDDLPSWFTAPPWATVLLRHKDGELAWAEGLREDARVENLNRPQPDEALDYNCEDWYTIVASRPAL